MNDMESVYDANSLLDAFNKSKKGKVLSKVLRSFDKNFERLQ